MAYLSGSTLPVLGASQSRYTPFSVTSPVKFIGGPMLWGIVVDVVVDVVVVVTVPVSDKSVTSSYSLVPHSDVFPSPNCSG